jgi:hypothetical protein
MALKKPVQEPANVEQFLGSIEQLLSSHGMDPQSGCPEHRHLEFCGVFPTHCINMHLVGMTDQEWFEYDERQEQRKSRRHFPDHVGDEGNYGWRFSRLFEPSNN